MKSRWQMLAFFKRMHEGREPFENIDLYFPFYVEAGNTVTHGNGKRLTFKERKVFESIEAMLKYVDTRAGTAGKGTMLMEADNDEV